jgi:ATP-binding cassette subfamily F protein 3
MSRRAARRRERKQHSNLDETATSAENVGQSCSEWSNASFSVNKKDPKKWERGKKITANPLLKPKSKVQVPEPPPPAPPPPPTTTTLPMSSATTTGNHLNPFSVGLLHPDAIPSKKTTVTSATIHSLHGASFEQLQSADGDDLDDFTAEWERVKASGEHWGGRNRGGRGIKMTTGNERDVVVEGFTMAYDGEVLLNRSTLRLVKGRRYGLIGYNGCGKSTLMRRIARKAVPGFPLHLSVSYVDQELRQYSKSTMTAVEVLQQTTGNDQSTDILEELRQEQIMLEELEGEQDNDVVQRLCEIAEYLESTEHHSTLRQRSSSEECLSFLMNYFDFSKEMATNVSVLHLSGGWRMRLALAIAVASEPDVLLLDEPTNHLDIEGVFWLSKVLKSDDYNTKKSNTNKGKKNRKNNESSTPFSNPNMTVLIVSHDRSFLNHTIDEVILFRDKQLTYHPGKYDLFERSQAEKVSNKIRLLKERGKAVEHAKKSLEKHKQAMLSLKRNKKGFNPKKEKQEASHRKKQVQRAGFYRDDGKRYKTMSLKDLNTDYLPSKINANDVDLQAAMIKLQEFKFPKVDPTELRLTDATSSVVFSLENVSCKYQSMKKNVLSNVTLSLSMGSRVGIVGPNGAGKTTLLHMMSSGGSDHPTEDLQLNTNAGTIFVHRNLRRCEISQHHVKSLENHLNVSPVHVILHHHAECKVQDARQLLGGFGLVGDTALQPVKLLSGGQKARLAMACAVHRRPHMIVMDEPTNHLDTNSLDGLVKSLGKYDGSLVIVSHDESFLKSICNELWIVKDGTVRVVRCLDKEAFKNAFDRYALSVRKKL